MRKILLFCIVSMALGMVMAGIGQAEDLSPLKSFWCEARTDYFSTATEAGQGAAVDAFGCTFVRLEGYVFPTEQAGTVPLKLYFNRDMKEYYSTTPQTGEKAAMDTGFEFVRIEGHIMPATENPAQR